jgi:AAA domain
MTLTIEKYYAMSESEYLALSREEINSLPPYDYDEMIPEDKLYPWFRHADGTLGDRPFPDFTEEQIERAFNPAFDFVLGPLGDAVHGLFARGSLHLIQGASGAGKTTFALTMLKAQLRKEIFFGRQGKGAEYLVIWQDRGKYELERQLDNMGMRNDPPPYVTPTIDQMNANPHVAIEQILLDLQKERDSILGGPKVLLVEGLDMWVTDAKDMKHVSVLATELRALAERKHISIIATVGMPKMKPKEVYQAPRDRAFGSSAWARKADTVIDITVDEATGNRQVLLLSRTGPPQKLTLGFEGGLLVPAGITVGPVDESVGPVKKPTIKELKRVHQCSTAKAQQLQREWEPRDGERDGRS